MKELVVVPTRAGSLLVRRSPHGAKRYTRIALISAILINVGTMFGLGVYIIENTADTDADTDTNSTQTVQKQVHPLLNDETDEIEIGPFVSNSNSSELQQKVTLATLEPATDVHSVNGKTSDLGAPGDHMQPTNGLDVAAQSSHLGRADEKTNIAIKATIPNDVETTHILPVAGENKPKLESKPIQHSNNGAKTQTTTQAKTQAKTHAKTQAKTQAKTHATMDAALAMMASGKNTTEDKPDAGEKTQAVPIIFSMPTPYSSSTQKRLSDTPQSQTNSTQRVTPESMDNINDANLNSPDDIHKFRNSLAMLSTDLRGNEAVNLSNSPKVRLNTNAEALAIIVNSRNTQVIRYSDLRNYYTDKISEWKSGKKISIYHLPLDSNERAIFAQQILKMSALEAATMESNRVITNRSVNPSVTKVSKLVKAFVARNPSAIGYIPLADVADDPGIRVVMTLTQ